MTSENQIPLIPNLIIINLILILFIYINTSQLHQGPCKNVIETPEWAQFLTERKQSLQNTTLILSKAMSKYTHPYTLLEDDQQYVCGVPYKICELFSGSFVCEMQEVHLTVRK